MRSKRSSRPEILSESGIARTIQVDLQTRSCALISAVASQLGQHSALLWQSQSEGWKCWCPSSRAWLFSQWRAGLRAMRQARRAACTKASARSADQRSGGALDEHRRKVEVGRGIGPILSGEEQIDIESSLCGLSTTGYGKIGVEGKDARRKRTARVSGTAIEIELKSPQDVRQASYPAVSTSPPLPSRHCEREKRACRLRIRRARLGRRDRARCQTSVRVLESISC